jgi:hypothetical protein
MSESPSLARLFDLAVAFRHAFEQKMQSDRVLENKFTASLREDDNKTGNALSANYFDQVPEDLELAVLSGQEIDEVSDTAATAAIQLAEYTARLALRAATENELSTLVPEQSRSAEVSSSFAANSAPALAKLFAPKEP